MKKEILIVDDENKICESLAFALEEAGWVPHMAFNGTTAVGLISKQKFDAIIIDINLPQVGGLMVAENSRASRLNGDTPICMITGVPVGEDVLLAKELKVKLFFVKPLKLDEIVTAIEKI